MKQHLIVPEWLKLEVDTRRKLINQFSIPKSGVVEVANNQLVCDGVTEKDLKELGIGKMIGYLAEDLSFYSESLFNDLLNLTIKKINGENITPAQKSSEQVSDTETNKGTKGRTGKKEVNLPPVA